MITKDEALKLALEALVDARVRPPHKQDSSKYEHAITAIREALDEQPAQQKEPLVTKNKSGITLHVGWDDLPVGTKLYTSPQPSKPLTYAQIMRMASKSGLDLEPPKKMSWVEVQGRHEHLLILARAIEAAHGIKGDA